MHTVWDMCMHIQDFLFDLDQSGDIKDITVGHMCVVSEVDDREGDCKLSKSSFDIVMVVFKEWSWVESLGEDEGSRRTNLPAIDRQLKHRYYYVSPLGNYIGHGELCINYYTRHKIDHVPCLTVQILELRSIQD